MTEETVSATTTISTSAETVGFATSSMANG